MQEGVMKSSKLFAIAAAIVASVPLAGRAVQVADGTVYFDSPPRLEKAVTTIDSPRAFGATYYFTLTIPEDAGEPLGRLTVAQHEGFDEVRYRDEKTLAFEGDRWNRGEEVSLGLVASDRETNTISVRFDPPVEPGNRITVGLKPVRNPDLDGIYLFGVTAYPVGEKAHGQFLGFGRLHFYSNDSD